MAVQKTMVSDTGITVENAYYRIDEYSCSSTNVVNARVRAYVSRDAQREGKTFLEGSEFIATITGDYTDSAVNPKKQIYEHIKTLDGFEDSVDVLE